MLLCVKHKRDAFLVSNTPPDRWLVVFVDPSSRYLQDLPNKKRSDRVQLVFFLPQSPTSFIFVCSILLRLPVHLQPPSLVPPCVSLFQVLLGTSRDPLPHRHRQLDVLRPRHGR
ncbi:unnamed protein product, partial [Ectocarpus sp. 13 AM-2016]